MNTITTRSLAPLALLAAAALALAGCTATTAEDGGTTTPTAAESASLTDGWVKAAEDGMTAAFGTLTNRGEAEVVLVSATSPSATMIEIHETIEDGSGTMVMQQKEGGFTIPAGSSLDLEPGGNHIMFMGLTGPIAAGDEVELTLVFSDGSEYSVEVPAKDYSGANENYVDGSHADGMDMGD